MRLATRLTTGLLLAAVTASAAMGQTSPQQRPRSPEPLKPGRSAGVKTAQAGIPNIGLALVGASAVIALVVVTTSGGGKTDTSQPNSQSVVGTAP
jgi:hypothetical protein